MILIKGRLPRLAVDYIQAKQLLDVLMSVKNGKPDMLLVESLTLGWAEGIEELKKEMIKNKEEKK